MRPINRSKACIVYSDGKYAEKIVNGVKIMRWLRKQLMPDEFSDWLAYLLQFHILDYADYELDDGDVLLVRYNVSEIQVERTDIIPLLDKYYQDIVIQKVGNRGSESFNIWVDNRLSSMIREGYAYGKYIYAREYDRNVYSSSRIVSTCRDAMDDVINRFPHAPRHYFWYTGPIDF